MKDEIEWAFWQFQKALLFWKDAMNLRFEPNHINQLRNLFPEISDEDWQLVMETLSTGTIKEAADRFGMSYCAARKRLSRMYCDVGVEMNLRALIKLFNDLVGE